MVENEHYLLQTSLLASMLAQTAQIGQADYIKNIHETFNNYHIFCVALLNKALADNTQSSLMLVLLSFLKSF